MSHIILPVAAAAAGVMEGATVVELHHEERTIQVRSPGAFRLYLAARALAGLPMRELGS